MPISISESDPMSVTAPRAFVVAIDGPAAAGKGTLALALAERLGLAHLDTGLLYRAIGKLMEVRGYDLDDAELAGEFARNLDPDDLARDDLRGREAGELASRVAVHPQVRSALVDFQRAFAARLPGAVLDGRDIGTVICPEADVKIFVTASAEVRARRRTDELAAKGREVDYARILEETRERDERDSGRTVAPLKPAADAVVLDTSALDRDAALAEALAIVAAKRTG
jgi:cytidylate kinase